MSEWRAKAAVSVVLGVVAVGLLVRAARRDATSPQTTTAVADAASADSSAPVAIADAGSAAPVDATADLDAHADADADDAADDGAADASGAVCERLAKRTRAALAEVHSRIRHSDWKAPELCVQTARATWALVVERAVTGGPVGTDDTDGIGLAVSLVHVDAAGHEVAVLPSKALQETWRLEAGTLVVNVTIAPTWGSVDLKSLATFDYDGDDDPEIVLQADGNDEGPDRYATEAWTFHGGKVVPFPPLARLTIRSMPDLDADGRPDVVTAGPYAHVQSQSGIGDNYPIAPPYFALHSLPGGAFSGTDAIAQAYTRAKCKSRPALDLGTSSSPTQFDDDVAVHVVCAKVWGVTAAEIGRAWTKVCGDVDSGVTVECQAWPKQLGAIAPPFVLTR